MSSNIRACVVEDTRWNCASGSCVLCISTLTTTQVLFNLFFVVPHNLTLRTRHCLKVRFCSSSNVTFVQSFRPLFFSDPRGEVQSVPHCPVDFPKTFTRHCVSSLCIWLYFSINVCTGFLNFDPTLKIISRIFAWSGTHDQRRTNLGQN